jgi:hypothetical protein
MIFGTSYTQFQASGNESSAYYDRDLKEIVNPTCSPLGILMLMMGAV